MPIKTYGETARAHLTAVDTEQAFVDDLTKWINNRISSGTYCRLSVSIQGGKVEKASIERLYVPKGNGIM